MRAWKIHILAYNSSKETLEFLFKLHYVFSLWRLDRKFVYLVCWLVSCYRDNCDSLYQILLILKLEELLIVCTITACLISWHFLYVIDSLGLLYSLLRSARLALRNSIMLTADCIFWLIFIWSFSIKGLGQFFGIAFWMLIFDQNSKDYNPKNSLILWIKKKRSSPFYGQ